MANRRYPRPCVEEKRREEKRREEKRRKGYSFDIFAENPVQYELTWHPW
jgi:hypothetical protein